MARKFLTPVVPPALGSDPVNAVSGAIYFNTVIHALKYYNGTMWEEIGSGGGGGGSSTATAIQALPEAPSSPIQGQVYFDTQERTIKTYNDAIWYDVAGPKEVLDHIHYTDGLVRYVDYGKYVSETIVVMDGGTSNSVYSGDIIDGGNS